MIYEKTSSRDLPWRRYPAANCPFQIIEKEVEFFSYQPLKDALLHNL